ncbi:Glutathione-regulated potassium-efflux system protein KefC [Vibrio stylophorae]|uniref:Glutathione-regulated potassium-efflux system protein KefB n=1 Tax=Vibrio stylophorae TaxID=659351 RepID=A0ABM8ZW47_9VIBR|nr:glutathione-regulated potassium-efflux system protein KefB [Vibrio stylophorae]CAH0534548.1 Glutathione-regulated potassium-efflux system protein KefC [Vibrio stylophorae]
MSESLIVLGLLLLVAAVVAVPLAQRLGLGAVLGYLLAGMVIGPWGMGWVGDVDAILHFSEFGVVLLLFLIGLELNPRKLWQMRRPIFGLGGAQVGLTTLAIAAVIWLVCEGLALRWQTILAIAMGLALSSTAIGMRLIEERNWGQTETGQAGFAVLLFQDIAVIPMLALLSLLAGSGDMHWLVLGYKFFAVLVVLVVGHFALLPLLRYVVRSQVRELFTMTTLLLVMAMAFAMQYLGLSMALGSFLAGVLLADSEFRHELEITIEPFKGLLLGLFFISVGMAVHLNVLWQQPVAILLAVTALLLLKTLLLYLLAYLMGVAAKARSQLAMLLGQGGEFAFVMFTAAYGQQLLSQSQLNFLLVVVSLSMMTTPLLLRLQQRWYARDLNPQSSTHEQAVPDRQPRVIITGFGRFGQVVGRLLFANKVRLTILERDPSQIELLRRFGYKVYFGDASQVDLMRAAGAQTAEAIVICTADPELVIKIVSVCQQHFPHLRILARARSRVEAYQLLNLGVDHFARETLNSALDLGREALVTLGMHPYQAKRAESHFKKLDAQMLRELLPRHTDSKLDASRSREARLELEELFAREMDYERAQHKQWE